MLFKSEVQNYNMPNAQLTYVPSFLNSTEADSLYEEVFKQTNWQHDDITIFGKTYPQPRLTALYSVNDQPYSYSNITMHPRPLTKVLKELLIKVNIYSKHQFNTLLLNLYRDGSDSNGWHADNEKELGKNPFIASLSLGVERPFHFKHRTIKEQRHKLLLNHGSLLLMGGEMQHYWLHQIAKTKKVIGPRINLTFRTLV